jgi:carboxymethylenebutenolidase
MPSFWENIRMPEATDERESGANIAEAGDMAAYVSFPPPSAGTSLPAIIVVQEAFGANQHIQKVADGFAAEGYVAVAPALFHRNERNPNPMLGYTPDDFDAAVNTYMPELTGQGIIEDINATVDYLQRTYPRTRGQKVGIVGYCMGGRVVYLAAGNCSGIDAGVVYYGGAILNAYSDGVTPIDGTGNINIPLMGNFGETDGNPTPDDVTKIEAALSAAGKSFDFKMYPGAGHGFNCDDRDSYNQAAADDAQARTIAFFNEHLK